MSIYPRTKTIGAVRATMSDLTKFAQHTGQLIEDAVREEACLTARAAIKHSPSMSAPIHPSAREKTGRFVSGGGNGGDGDEKVSLAYGERAVALDIRRIVHTADDSLLTATDDFSNVDDYIRWRTQGRGRDSLNNSALNRIRLNTDHLEAYKAFKSIFHGRNAANKKLDVGGLTAWHEAMKKKYRHRIRKNFTVDSTFFNRADGYRVADESAILSVISTSQKNVGYLKSGWLQCIKQIGPTRIKTRKYPMGVEKQYGLNRLAGYIKRFSAQGRAMINFPSLFDSNAPNKVYRINIVNMVGDADRAGTTAKTIDKTLAYRAANRKGKLKKLLNLSIDQFNRGQ